MKTSVFVAPKGRHGLFSKRAQAQGWGLSDKLAHAASRPGQVTSSWLHIAPGFLAISSLFASLHRSLQLSRR